MVISQGTGADGLDNGVAMACRRGGGPLLVVAAAFMLAGCASERGANAQAQRAAAAPVLRPLLTLAGARLVAAADPTGLPLPRAAPAPMTPFIHPAAGTLSGNDLYIADTGSGRVYRFDQTLATMVVLPRVPAVPGVRLAAGSDTSLYVLDPPGRRVLRFGRDGRLLATYADRLNLASPVAVAVDDARGEVFVADSTYRHLLAFHPLGRAAEVIVPRGDDRNRVLGIAGLALAHDGIHIVDPLCRCVAVMARDGTVRATYGHHDMGQPGAIAIDRHQRVFVVDTFDRSVRVFAAGRLIDRIPAAVLGVLEVSDLSVMESRLIVVDGSGARVVVAQVAAPRRETP